MTKIVTTLDLFIENTKSPISLFIKNDPTDSGSGNLRAPLVVVGATGNPVGRFGVDLFVQQPGKNNELMPLIISGPPSATSSTTFPLLIQNFGGSSFDDIELFLRGTAAFYYYTLQYYFDVGAPTTYVISFPTYGGIDFETTDNTSVMLDEFRTHFAGSGLNFVDVTGLGTIADPFIVKIKTLDSGLTSTLTIDISNGGDIEAYYIVGNPVYDEINWIYDSTLPPTAYDIVLNGVTAALNTSMDLAAITAATNAAWGTSVYSYGYYNTYNDNAVTTTVSVLLRPIGIAEWSYDYDLYMGESDFITTNMTLSIGRGTPVENSNMPLFISQQTNQATVPMFVKAQKIETGVDLIVEGKYHGTGNTTLVIPVVKDSGNKPLNLFTHGY